jgi:hypothetical protein
MSGWIKLHRRLAERNSWLSETFTRGQAWVDLLMLTNYQPGYILVAGQKVDIQRGECGWSQLQLAKRWRWSRGKIARFMDELKTDSQIEMKTSTRTTIIKICNYDTYQFQENETVQQTGQQIEQQTDNRQDTNKEEKRRIRNNSTYPCPEDVDAEVWRDFTALRKSKRAPISETWLKGVRAKAGQAGLTFQQACELMILRNWQGFEVEWVLKDRKASDVAKPKPSGLTTANLADRHRELGISA